MEIGIGIPNSVVGTTGAQLLDWARRADPGRFLEHWLDRRSVLAQQITNGRLTLGLGVGWRRNDYLLTRWDFHSRRRAFDAQVGRD
jgi:hypothetical protein